MKKKAIRYIVTVLLGMVLTVSAHAQYRHEFHGGAGWGLQYIKYNKSGNNNVGYNLVLGYDFFFTKNLGLGTGAELSFYNGKTGPFNFTSKQTGLRDYQNDVFDYNSAVTGYSEEQNATLLNIPLMLRYQMSGNNKFYLSAGAKIGIPINGTYKANGAKYFNTADYTEKGIPPLDVPEFMGFGPFTDKSFEGDLKLKTSIIASAETGMKWDLGKSWSLYSGIYVDYGLTDMIDGSRDKSIITYNINEPMNFKNASVLASSYSDNGKQQNFTDKVIPVAFGLKLSIAFGSSEILKRAQAVIAPVIKDDTAEREDEAKRKADEEAERQRIAAGADARRKAEEIAEKERITQAEIQRKAEEIRIVKTEIAIPVAGYTVNGTALSAEKKSELDKKIELLKKYPELSITCEGYTCNLGSERMNENIGLKRTEVAKEYLMQNGISESRITVISKGKSNPVAPNNNEENRRKNRRVEFIVR